jgi:gliding motility-associated-like protein
MLAFLLVFAHENFAQLYCSNCPGRDTTSYTNGYENDSLYFLCQAEVAVLRVEWPQADLNTVRWFRFVSATNLWSLLSTQTEVPSGNYNNATPGGYRVQVSDDAGEVIFEDICWISRINSPPVVNANTLQPGCGTVQLSGLYFPGLITGYYNPPPTNFNDPYLFNANSNIEICFDIIHPILSDLRIELVSPPSCGSQTVVLTSTQTPANADSICYNSDAVNLCFSNTSNLNYDLCELGSENVGGVFGAYGLNAQAIDWSSIQGCDVTQPGWAIHVFDCFGGANGFWESASMIITDDGNNGLPIYHEFFPESGQNNTILDFGCEGEAFTIIELDRPYPQASIIGQGVGVVWETNPPIELPNNGVGLNLLLDPGPTQDVYFSLSLSNIELGDACGAQSYDVEFFDYIQPDSTVITLTDSILCLTDEPLLLTSTIEEGSWIGPVDSVELGVLFTPDSVGLYSISFEPVSSCIDRTEVFVRVDQAPILDLPDAQSFCSTDTVMFLDANPPNGLWSGVGITDASEGTFDPSLVLSGETILQYIAGINCPASANVSFTVETFMPLQILNIDTTVCDQSLPLDLNVNLLSTTWQGEGITSGALGIFNPAIAGAGEHVIVARYDQGCFDTDTITVFVDDGTLAIESLNPICVGSDTLDLQVEADSGFWYGTGIIDSLQGMVATELLGPGNNQFYYTLRNACAFTDSVTLFVEEFIPLQILLSDTVVCVESGTLNLESNLAQVQWQGDGVISDNGGLFSADSAGVGEFIIVATYDQACSSSDSVLIEVEDATIVLQPLSPICIDAESLSLQVMEGIGVWSGEGVVDAIQGIVNPSTLSAGIHYFNYTLSNSCASVDSVSIEIVDFPVIDLLLPAGICVDQSPIDIEANLTGGQFSGDGVEGSNAQWLFNPQQASEGSAIIQYVYTDVCTSTLVDSIEVYPLPVLIIAADTSICPEGSAQLFASGAAQYSWSPAGSLQSPDLAFTEAQPDDSTLYTVEGISEFGCVASEDVMVNVFASPIPTTNGPIEICKGESEVLEVNGLVSAQWSGPSLETPGDSLTVASPSQTTTYLVGGFDSNGCFGDTTLEVVVYEPIAFFNSSDTLGTPPMEVFFENLSEGDFFIWDFGNGDSLVTNDINAAVSTIFDGEQFHTITLTAFLNGCPAVYSYTLETYYDSELLIIPNVVSPNGDGSNDAWRVVTRNMADMQVDIFNRWGTLIEQVDGINDTWDPKDVSAGTYYYRLLATGLDGEVYNREGQITVLISEN